MAATASSDKTAGRPRSNRTSWQEAMKRAIRDPVILCRELRLPERLGLEAKEAAGSFPLFAPREYVARMTPGDPDDPLLRQVLPSLAELRQVAGFVADPLEETDPEGDREPGLLRKYQGRALLVTTGACAVHCRYCFRRHYPYSSGPRSIEQWRPALERIESDTTIEEVLLSGGDPLTLPDVRLFELIEALEHIGHLRRLRIHSRLPVVIPQRITARLAMRLRSSRLTTFVVAHFNHPAEIGRDSGDPVNRALDRLIDSGVPVLNQAVLLRGVNDDVDTLVELHRRLVDARVLPYYLHQLDPVAGAAHYETDVATGRRLMRRLRERLPGYAVPRYVRERPGEPGKTPLPP